MDDDSSDKIFVAELVDSISRVRRFQRPYIFRDFQINKNHLKNQVIINFTLQWI